MHRLKKRVSVLFLSCAMSLAYSSSFADVVDGISWLNSIATSDGSITTPTSPATSFQSTAESLLAFSASGQPVQPASDAAVSFLLSESYNNTENLSRKIAIGRLYGIDVSPLVAELIASQSSDGGLGEMSGFESSELDTSVALQVLDPGSLAATRSLGFLLANQNPDGGFSLTAGGESVGYVTAIVIQSLQRLQPFVDVSDRINGAVAFLISCQLPTGSWGSDWQNALALRALIPAEPNSAQWSAVADQLRASQLPNGSWSNDAYATALAIQAIVLADQAAVIVIPSTGSATGRIVNTANGLPVVGAAVTVNGVISPNQVSDLDGVFRVAGITPGSTTIEIAADGFQSTTIVQSIVADDVANLGEISLTPTPGTAFVSGRVTDAVSGLGVSGATVALSPTVGAVQTAFTNSSGDFSIATEPSPFSISVTAPTYNSVSATGAIVADQNLNFGIQLTLSGTAPNPVTDIIGRAINSVSLEPVVGATISIDGGASSTTTDTDGRFIAEVAVAGVISLNFAASGHLPVTLEALTAAGSRTDIGSVYLVGVQPIATTTIAGVVRDVDSFAPVANAEVRIDSAGLTTHTAVDGSYVISGIPSLNFTSEAHAVGYLSGSQVISVAEPGFRGVDFLLTQAASQDLQVVSAEFESGRTVFPALDSERVNVTLVNSGSSIISTQLFYKLVDANGVTVRRSPIAPIGLVGGIFTDVPAMSTVDITFRWDSERIVPGDYSLVVQAFNPESGQLLSERSIGLTIADTRQVGGQVEFDPPITQLGTNQPIRVTAQLVNQGNVTIDSGTITATVTLRNGGDAQVRDLISTRIFSEQPDLSSPQGMDLDSQGILYVADSGLDSIVRIAPDGTTSVVADQLTNPVDVDIDSTGMHIAQANRYVFVGFDGSRREEPLSFSPVAVEALASGSVMLSAGNSLYELIGGVGPAVLRIDQGLAAPTGLTIDPNGSILIADGDNGIWDFSSGVLRPLRTDLGRVSKVAVAGDGTIYFTNTSLGTLSRIESDGSVSIVASGLTGLVGLEIASNGNAIVGNSMTDEILEITPAGIQSVLAFSPIFSPTAGAVDPSGRTLFVGGDQTLYALDGDGTFAEIASLGFRPTAMDVGSAGTIAMAGGNQLTVLDAAGLPIQETTLTFSANGIAVDTDVVVANSTGGLVRVDSAGIESHYLPELGTPRNSIPAPGGAAYVLTDNGFLIRQESDASFSIIEQGLVNPTGLTVDASGDIYITETSTRRIRRISPTGGITEVLTTTFVPSGIAVLGPDDFLVSVLNDARIFRVDATGETLIVTVGLGLPIDNEIVIASDGAAWVTHPGQGRVSRIDIATSNVITISASSGGRPGALSPGNAGDVFAAQRGRLQRFLPDGTSDPVIFVTGLPFGSFSSGPTGLVPRVSGGWWFYQSNDFIYEIDSSNTVVEDYIATVAANDVQFVPSGGLAIATPLGIGLVGGPFEFPRRAASEVVDKLAVESSTSLIATSLSTIRRIDMSSETSTVLRSGFQRLKFVDVATNGNIVVGDESESRLLTLDAAGNTIDDVFGIDKPSAITIAPDGTVLIATDGATSQILSLSSSGLPTRFSTLRSVDAMAVRADGSMVASDNFEIHNIDVSGQVTQSFREFGVTGVTVDLSGNVFGTNFFDSTLISINSDLSFKVQASGVGNIVDIESRAGGELQFIDSAAGSLGRVVGGDGLSITAAGLIAPTALAVNDDGTRTVLNLAGSLVEYDAQDQFERLATRGQFPGNTRGLARKNTDVFYVSQPGGSVSRPVGSTIYRSTVELAGESAGNVGDIAFTATVPFGQLLLSGESVLADFGEFTPDVSGDFTATAVITSGGASGELSNQLHVGPGAEADLAVINDQVGIGDIAETAVLTISSGGSSSIFQIDPNAPIFSTRTLHSFNQSPVGDSAGNIYVSRKNFSGTNSGELHKVFPDGSSEIIATGLNHGGDLAIDNNDTIYFGADFFGDIFASTTDGNISVVANVADIGIAHFRTGFINGIDITPDGTLGIATEFTALANVSLDGSSIEVVGETQGSFNHTLAVDGDGNYYAYTSKIGEVLQIEGDEVIEPELNAGSLPHLTRVAPDGTVSTILPYTGDSNHGVFFGDTLTRDCSGNILMAPDLLDGVRSTTLSDTVYQLDRRTGALRTVLTGQALDPRLNRIHSLQYDRLGERLLIMTAQFSVPGLPLANLWAIRAGCGGVEADVHVISRTDVDLNNADPAPDQTIDRADGTREFVWNISSATASEVQIDLSLLFKALTEGEQRPLFNEAFIEFTNSFQPGESVRVPIGIPSVFAAGRVTANLATTGTEFGANTNVPLTVVVQNGGNNVFDGRASFVVEDNAGNQVATLAGADIVTLASLQSTSISGNWNTGTTFAGNYTIRAEIANSAQNLIASDTATVEVVTSTSGTPDAVATVITDKIDYAAWDTINVTARLQNATMNGVISSTTSVLSVLDSAGTTIFAAAGSFGELQPGQLLQYPVSFALSDAQVGQYSVMLVVTDAVTGADVAIAVDTFNVARTESASLRGSVDVQFKQVQAGTPNNCTFTTDNISATPVAVVSLTYRAVNLDTQATISVTNETVTLPANGQQLATVAIDTNGLADGAYACVLEATVATENTNLAGATFGISSASLLVTTNVSTDRSEYQALEVAMIASEVRNQSTQASGPLSVTTTVFAPDSSIFSTRTDAIADLNGGTMLVFMSTVSFGQSVPGDYLIASVVTAPDGSEVASDEVAVHLLSTNDTGAGIVAALSINPDPVEVGDVVDIAAVVTNNGNATVPTAPLIWRIIDSTTQQVISEVSSSMQNLVPNGSTSDAITWSVDVAPDTVIDVLLLAEFGGVQKSIGTTQFVVNEKRIDIEASVGLGPRGRLLILLDPWLDELTVDGEREFLETVLQAEGWSYTITSTDTDFTAEFDTGMYSSFALLSASVKLSNVTQKELVTAVLNGAGLAVAGDHDSRNNKLDPALGVKGLGNLPDASGFSSQASALFTDASFDFQSVIKKRTFKLQGATSVATYTGTNVGETSVTIYDFAAGKSVTAGFDLLAEAQLAGETSLLREFLAQVIDFPHPSSVSVDPGVAVPIELTVTNIGAATPGRAFIHLPATLVLADGGDTTPINPLELRWNFELDVDESKTVSFWVISPVFVDEIHIDIQSGSDPDFIDEESLIFVLDPGQ